MSVRIRVVNIIHHPYVTSDPCSLQDGSMGGFSNSHDIPRFKTFKKRPHTHSSSKSGQGVHNHRKSVFLYHRLLSIHCCLGAIYVVF